MNPLQTIKQRFGIIGNSSLIDKALSTAIQVAPTDLTVLITGESGVGKEAISQIIHSLSKRKHEQFIAINCGAIPEGTVDSELFGHVKGAFTNALEDRKGYFEAANQGTIFLDEVAELPLNTQARLLRVLENGEYIRVGSSKVQKINIRVISATNDDLLQAVTNGKFREDLYYRLSTVPIYIPPLRERKEDIYILFRKFMTDFQDKYSVPSIYLDAEAQNLMQNYNWPGNVRQLKNITEQIVALEAGHQTVTLDAETISKYIPKQTAGLPTVFQRKEKCEDSTTIMRDLLYKAIFDIKKDVVDVKKNTAEIIRFITNGKDSVLDRPISEKGLPPPIEYQLETTNAGEIGLSNPPNSSIIDNESDIETLSLSATEAELIKKALKKHNGKRRLAAKELGISERTLYRKLKILNFIIE